jgi:hypothetical protein
MQVNSFTFIQMYDDVLEVAAHLLDKGWTYAKSMGVSESEMLNWRLIDDMHPLSFQLAGVCDLARQWPARIAGLPEPENTPPDLDVAGFQGAIAGARDYLNALKPEQFEGRDDEDFTRTSGFGVTQTLSRGRWLTYFATTNLYFHLSTAYGILRIKGAPLGKVDLFPGGLSEPSPMRIGARGPA